MPERPERGLYYPDGSFKRISPIIQKPEPLERPSLDQKLTQFKHLQELSHENDIWKNEVKLDIKTNGMPFFLMPLSDIHFGSTGLHYDKLKEYLDYLKNYPVYTVLVGDLVDNFSPSFFPDGMMDQLEEPTSQIETARMFFKEYEDKILGVWSGNHDATAHSKAGINIYNWLSEDLNIPLLVGGSPLRIKVDNQDYTIRGVHKIARFFSSFNPTHAGKRMLEFVGDADVVVTGHYHRGAVEKVTHRENTKPVIVSCGTFREDDRWAKEAGIITPMQVFFPTLIFFPDQKNVEAIENIDSAKQIIDGLASYTKQLAVAGMGLKEKIK